MANILKIDLSASPSPWPSLILVLLAMGCLTVCPRTNAQFEDTRSSRTDLVKKVRESIPKFENKTLVVCILVREPFVSYRPPPEILMSEEFVALNGSTLVASGDLSAIRHAEKLAEKLNRQAMADLNNYHGIAMEVVKRLSFVFRFKVRVTRTKDNQFGTMRRNGSWSGIVGALVNKDADLGVTALSITAKRAAFVDFTQAYYVETTSMVLRIPEQVQNFFVIIEPFSSLVWFALMAAILCLIGLIALMTRLEDSQRQRHKLHKLAKLIRERQGTRTSLSLNDQLASHYFARMFERQLTALKEAQRGGEFGSTWTDRLYYSTACVLNILLNKDIRHPPHQAPIRILVCIWWLATIVIVNVYLGTLFEQLVLPHPARSIESLEELVQQDRVKWCVTAGSAIEELFSQADPSSVYGQLGAKMRRVASVDDGIERVLTDGWAFIREHSMLTFKLEQEHRKLGACRMQLAKEQFFSVGLALALQRNSTYLEPFNAALTLMIENGFIARWQSQYWPPKSQFTECQNSQQLYGQSEPLSLRHFLSIYLVCGCIFVFALLVLLYQNGLRALAWLRPRVDTLDSS